MLSLYRYAPTVFKAEMDWPQDWAFVVAFSGVRAEKTREALERYNLASRRASLAVEQCNRKLGRDFRTLGEVLDAMPPSGEASLLRDIEARQEPAWQELGLADRIRMFLLEERRHIPRAVQSLLWRDATGFGAALTASHRASGRLLWNIVPEIDHLQRSAVRLGAFGATGFGAGFGGSTVAVLPASAADGFCAAWQEAYCRRYPQAAAESQFFRTSPASGILVWDPGGPKRWVDGMFGE
jgi:galactokinase